MLLQEPNTVAKISKNRVIPRTHSVAERRFVELSPRLPEQHSSLQDRIDYYTEQFKEQEHKYKIHENLAYTFEMKYYAAYKSENEEDAVKYACYAKQSRIRATEVKLESLKIEQRGLGAKIEKLSAGLLVANGEQEILSILGEITRQQKLQDKNKSSRKNLAICIRRLTSEKAELMEKLLF